ncbi:uncharacterized protein LOC118922371 [Manis pentadactyla]|uniref:uncharacterized protein LOC118922371 n=1 Tax=Manis pentadactyla TaxID=143292 RepID=UPI00255CB9F6|nr:uncharacterized protein LOC118922371 [Manis pentadactyla]
MAWKSKDAGLPLPPASAPAPSGTARQHGTWRGALPGRAPSRGNRKWAAPARAARGPPKRPARGAGRGGRETDTTRALPRRLLRPARPRLAQGESLSTATPTHQRKRGAGRQSGGPGCATDAHAWSRRAGGPGRRFPGRLSGAVPQQPKECWQRTPAAITLAVHARPLLIARRDPRDPPRLASAPEFRPADATRPPARPACSWRSSRSPAHSPQPASSPLHGPLPAIRPSAQPGPLSAASALPSALPLLVAHPPLSPVPSPHPGELLATRPLFLSAARCPARSPERSSRPATSPSPQPGPLFRSRRASPQPAPSPPAQPPPRSRARGLCALGDRHPVAAGGGGPFLPPEMATLGHRGRDQVVPLGEDGLGSHEHQVVVQSHWTIAGPSRDCGAGDTDPHLPQCVTMSKSHCVRAPSSRKVKKMRHRE